MRSATSEKSLNRLRPLFRMPCLPSSIRWAGLQAGGGAACGEGSMSSKAGGVVAEAGWQCRMHAEGRVRGLPACRLFHTNYSYQLQSMTVHACSSIPQRNHSARIAHMTICLRIMSAKHTMALLGSWLQRGGRRGRQQMVRQQQRRRRRQQQRAEAAVHAAAAAACRRHKASLIRRQPIIDSHPPTTHRKNSSTMRV